LTGARQAAGTGTRLLKNGGVGTTILIQEPMFKLLLLETRPQFLILIPCVLSPGIALAWKGGHFNGWHLALALVGSLLIHATSNILNDYTDWVRGTDRLVVRTPFSGGSGLIRSGDLSPRAVLREGIVTLLASLGIGFYFIRLYPGLIWLVALGALLAVLYTPVLTKWVITELFPGLGLGVLPVLGAYIVMQTPGPVSLPADVIWASVPAGILVSGLLWINEIPDIKADTATGRMHAVLLLGTRRAAWGYVVLLVLTYLSVIAPVVMGILPVWSLLGLLSIPVAVKAGTGALRNHDDIPALIPALGQNVITVLATPVLMAVGIFAAVLTG
jgi:1,4-dihydroxy-2-naphthoate octaprenyltransferase